MPTWAWVVIIVGVVLVLGAIAWGAMSRRRTTKLRSRFGPEYERAVETASSRREAESELASRQERREQLNIRPLPAATRERYAEEWQIVQAEFVDSPATAVGNADLLVTKVMHDRGYPMDDFEQLAADVSVDHPRVVKDYRSAHRLCKTSKRGEASTEDLRRTIQHYRALFEELLGDTAAEPMAQERRLEASESSTRERSTR